MSRIQKIKDSIPSKFFFEKRFENSGHATKILSDVVLRYDNVEHNNIFNCSPILKKDQELHLFRKFNYLKYKLLKATTGFQPSEEDPCPKVSPSVDIEKLGSKSLDKIESIIKQISDSRNALIKANMRLIVRQVSKYAETNSFEREEYISNAYMHVMKCIELFDHRRGFKFSTYCVNGLKTNLYRDAVNLHRSQSRLDANENLIFFPAGQVDFSEANSSYNKSAVRRIFRSLARQKRGDLKVEVLKYSFGIGVENSLKQKDIAKIIGLSTTRVQQIRDQAIESVRHISYDPLL